MKKGYCTKPKNRNIQVALKTATQATQPAPKTETPTYAFTDGVTIPKSLFDESGLTLGAYVKSKNLVTISGNKYTVTKDSATQTFIYSGKDYVRIMGNDIYVNDNKITSASAELRKYVADGRLDITGLKSVTPPQNTNKLELKFADKTTTTLDGEKNTIITVTGEKTETLFVVGEKKMVVALGRTSYFDSTGKPLSKPEFEKRGEVSLTDSGGIKTGEIGGKEIFILSNEKIFENFDAEKEITYYTYGSTSDKVEAITKDGGVVIGHSITTSDGKVSYRWYDKNKRILNEYSDRGKFDGDKPIKQTQLLSDNTQAIINYDAQGKPVGNVQIGDKAITPAVFDKLKIGGKADFSKNNLDALLAKLPELKDAKLEKDGLKSGDKTYTIESKKISFEETKPNVKVEGKIDDFTQSTTATYKISNNVDKSKTLGLTDAQYQSLQQQIKSGYFSDNYQVSADGKTLGYGTKTFYKEKPSVQNVADSLLQSGMIIDTVQKNGITKTYYPNGEFAESKSSTSYVKYSSDYYPNEVNGIKIDYGVCGTTADNKNIPCTTAPVFTLIKDGKPIKCSETDNADNCKAAKLAVLQSRTGIALTAAYQAALGASALGNFLFGGERAFEGWKKSIDDLFTKSILGIVAAPEDFLCRSYIDKPGEGYALAPSPAGFAQAVAHIEADRSTAITYPDATNPLQNITEYLYKITFAVTAPNDQDVDFNVYLYPGERVLFVGSKHLDRGSTHREVGSSARVKYSRKIYDRVCIKFTTKVNFPDTVCNRINVYSEPTVLYGTALTPVQVASGAPAAAPPAPGTPTTDW